MRGRNHKLKAATLAALIVAGTVVVSPGAAGEVTSEQVNGAIKRGVARLRISQRADGSWSGRGHKGGMTALCLLAMLNAGADPADPAIVRGVESLLAIKNGQTYVVSLKCQVLAATNDPKYRRELAAAAKWLASAQSQTTGMWSYSEKGSGDNSNTQFALLGLHEASKAGVKVPKRVWQQAKNHYTTTQMPDGGWTYRARAGKSYGSMTAAALASLYITGQELHVGGKKVFRGGRYPDCGKYVQNLPLAQGFQWLSNNFSVTQNPGKRSTWLHYYLYTLERVGMISGRRNFGRHDWYRLGAAHLVATERGGSWGGSLDKTAFALLFLAKGNRPVLFQKLRWEPPRPNDAQGWNRNINDLDHLTAFIGDKLGKPVTWQTASLEMSLRDLRQSPVVFVTGHQFPRFTQAEKDKLVGFVEAGGTLLFEACCGSKKFTTGFRAFAKEAFPQYVLDRLDRTHPVFRSYFDLRKHPKGTYDLEGIDVGCRTSVFFSPNALSCLWELQTIETYSDLAFKLGTNIAAYATGREKLPDKLDRIYLPTADNAKQPREMPRGAVRIARILYAGDYNADAKAMVHLAEILRDQANVDVVAKGKSVRPSDKTIFEYPVVFMTGHHSFTLPAEDIEGLRLYLKRGGVLLAEPCCGRPEFDKAFRAMTAKLFPQSPLKPLPADHPLYKGKVGIPLGRLRYRKVLADELRQAGRDDWRGTTTPPIEAVTLDGRTVILYSKYDYSCALEGDKPFSCRGYVDEDGKRLALDLFLYAISN